jgi:hypothetical protein
MVDLLVLTSSEYTINTMDVKITWNPCQRGRLCMVDLVLSSSEDTINNVDV